MPERIRHPLSRTMGLGRGWCHFLHGLARQGAVSILLFVAAAAGVWAQPLQEAAMDIVVEERLAADAPALSALVMRDGLVLARVADGLSDPAWDVPVGVETAFPAGSVSKILTAALVMTEVDAGRLDLDAPVTGQLPPDLRPLDADGADVDVTLRQLLSHSSGLPVTWDGFPPNPPVESREAYITASRTLMHPPGDRLVYSNAGFVLAGEIAAASAGRSFEDLVQERLLTPLGMARSSFDRAEAYEGSLAAGHTRAGDGSAQAEPHLDLTPMAAAGSLLTTPEDLARLATMFLNGGVFEGRQILSTAAVDEMMTLQARAHPELDEGFGLGFGVRDGDRGREIWWDGTTTSAAAHFALHPESGTAVIAMTNIAENQPTSVTGRRLLDLAVPEFAPGPAPSFPIAPEIEGYYLIPDFVDPDLWVFAYASPLRVWVEDATVRISSIGLGPMTLIPTGPTRFRAEGGLLDGASAVATEDLLQIGFLRAERLPVFLTPPALIAYAGAVALIGLFGLGFAARALWRRLRPAR